MKRYLGAVVFALFSVLLGGLIDRSAAINRIETDSPSASVNLASELRTDVGKTLETASDLDDATDDRHRTAGFVLQNADSAAREGSATGAAVDPAVLFDGSKWSGSESRNEGDFTSKIQVFRDERMDWNALADGPIPKPFLVSGRTYHVRGVLGKSTSIAYLADHRGRQFVVKDYSRHEDDEFIKRFMQYERRATEFYQENGIPAVSVVAVDLMQKIIIKEYEEGITGGEMAGYWRKLGISQDTYDKLMGLYRQEYNRAYQSFRFGQNNFYRWLKGKYPSEFKAIAENAGAEQFVSRGDLGINAFLYSFRKKRWVLFDP